MDAISIKCSNCDKETSKHTKNTKIEEMITKFVLNTILHHVGMLGITCSNKKMLYETKENNHPDWFNKGPWYNTAICSKLHVNFFNILLNTQE